MRRPTNHFQCASTRHRSTRVGRPSSSRAGFGLLAVGALVIGFPVAAEGQFAFGANATEIRATSPVVPGGHGMQVWGSYGLNRLSRVTGAASREWGGEAVRHAGSGRLTNESEGTFTSLQLGLQVMSPRWFGARLSTGVHLSRHYLRVQHTEYWEFDGVRWRSDQDGRTGYGWSLGLEAPEMLGDLIRLEAGFSDTTVDLDPRGCHAGAQECERTSVRRISVGVGVPIRGR
jgi:hypothetical protein